MRAIPLVAVVSFALPALARQPADLHAALDAVRGKFHAPGLAAAAIRDGKVLASGVCGVRAMDDSEQQPATLEDRWPLGSCTKAMTRFMIGRLIERGLLSPESTISTMLPDVKMRDEYKNVTLAQLLSHRAGIPPYTQIGPRMTPFLFRLKGTPQEQRAQFAAHVLDEEPAAAPGSKFLYSNAGYCIAAVAAERAAGKAWESLIGEEVFGPLGLGGSVAGADPHPDHQPRGHFREGESFRLAPRDMPGLAAMFPAGGVKASVEDFARFAGAYADIAAGRAVGGLSAASAAKIRELRPGDEVPSERPDTFFGGDGLFTAAFAIWPAEHLAIAVVSNAGDSDDLCAAAIEAIRAAYAPRAADQSRAAAPKLPPPQRFGFTINAENDSWIVGSVETGSIAEKAGLRAGDIIQTINGQTSPQIGPDGLQPLLRAARLKLAISRDGKPAEIELSR